jgi:hypothetical protein
VVRLCLRWAPVRIRTCILYVWGDDEPQTSDASKNFQNPAFSHKRGLIGDDYREYVPDGDLAQLVALAGALTRSLAEVRTSKELSFTVEWGTEFQPPWAEMREIIKDNSAGLIGLGLQALGIDSFVVTNRDTFSSDEVQTTHDFDNASMSRTTASLRARSARRASIWRIPGPSRRRSASHSRIGFTSQTRARSRPRPATSTCRRHSPGSPTWRRCAC